MGIIYHEFLLIATCEKTNFVHAIPMQIDKAKQSLIMKGVNTWSNYKKSKAITKAVEKLYEAQEIDHCRLTRLEGQTSLLAKTTKTAFQHIDYRLLHLDTKLNSTVKHMTEFFKRTETHFRFTWEALVSNRCGDPVAFKWLCHV